MSGSAAGGLRVLVHRATSVALGSSTSFHAGKLTVSAKQAASFFDDPAIGSVRLTWASPGDSVRIVKVLDAVEPRAKGAGGGSVFPGFLGSPLPQGKGETHALRGTALVVAGFLPRAQEALIDMSGPGAELSPLGGTHNLVVEFTPAEGAAWEDVDPALRRGQLALARHIAQATVGARPDAVEELPALGAGKEGLPRIGAITNLQTQGVFKDIFVYGRSFAGSMPALVDANEIADGAVVSGQFGHPGLKNPTIVHQNHPVVAALRARHRRDLNFAGVVLSPEPVEQARKELASANAAQLVASLGWDAAIVTKEGGGNADSDMALKMDALEELGIPAVGIFAEMSGPEGTGPPLVSPPTKAPTIVSSGNYDERITLPAVDKALGGGTFALADAPATSELEVPVAVIYMSLSCLGWSRLTSRPSDAVVAMPEPEHRAGGPVRVVHYINQFFGGVGGEEQASRPPELRDGAVGPGRKLSSLLGDAGEVVATVICGDDYAASTESAADEIVELIRQANADVVIAGPAFTSGRYGIACARVAAAAIKAGIPAAAAMNPENPGVVEAHGAPVLATGQTGRDMGPALERMAAAVPKAAAGETLTAEDGVVAKPARRNVFVESNAAERAVELALARLRGEDVTEVPPPEFGHVQPAGPIADATEALVALVTEGGLVPFGNPGRLESARATRWLRYPLTDQASLPTGEWMSVHGGFSTVAANADPNRILPLDAARAFEREGRIGRLHSEYLVTTGNGTSVADAARFGAEWAAELRRAGVQAAVLTST
jgi:glycine reductase complex component B subunit gamma